MKIFLLEDDASIAMGLEYSLHKEEYETRLARTVKEALEIISAEEFDLYLLDLTLPDGSGYDVCRTIKEKGDLPVIFLTAFDDEVNVVMGFDLGADDYISKPFRVNELMARIKSVLRRYNSEAGKSGILELHGLKINTNEAKVYKIGNEIVLTAMEYRLLLILLNNLIDNAIKASGPEKEICVSAYQKESRIVVEVKDDGIGMEAEQLEHIKEAFYRVDKARSRAGGGTGLGLSICEKIVQLHRARLTFDSRPGKGTIVRLYFPQPMEEKSFTSSQ